jgi:hypothetical protein
VALVALNARAIQTPNGRDRDSDDAYHSRKRLRRTAQDSHGKQQAYDTAGYDDSPRTVTATHSDATIRHCHARVYA